MMNKDGNTTWNSEETINITLDDSVDDFTFDISDHTVDTIDISSITTSTVDLDSGVSITLDDTHWADGITWEQIEFEDKMPSVAKVEDMCNDYPALRKAYENFKTIYKIVHQDWKGRQDNDNNFPF